MSYGTAEALVDAERPSRNLAIDRLRGALVFLMVAGDYMGGVAVIPAFLKHAPDIGFTVADTVAPCFVFLIGLNSGPSFSRRAAESLPRAYRHFLLRYLALVGIGAIISAGGTSLASTPTDWGVLQALGVAGLIGLVFIRFPTWARFIVGFLMLCAYQFLLDTSTLVAVLHSAHGGLIGALSWGALLVLSTAVADLWRRGIPTYAACCAILALAATVALVIVPVSKNRVSLSYVLLTLAISAIVFLAVDLASRIVANRPGFFCWWGQNSLAFYLLHLLVLAFVVLPPVPWWYAGAPPWLAALQLIVILLLMSVVAWWMHRRALRLGL